MLPRTFALALTASVICLSPAFAQTTIEKIAPESAVLVVGSKKLDNLREHFKQTPLWTLWQTDEIAKLRAEFVKNLGEGMDEMFQELGVEKETLVFPAGAVGFTLFTTRDPELDTPAVAFLVMAEYGNEAEALATDAFVQAALARGEKDNKFEFDHKDVSGRTVYTIDLAKMQDQAGEEDFDDIDMDPGMPFPMPTPQEMMKGFEKLHYVRDGKSVYLCSNMDTLAEALDVIDGKGAGNRAADRAEFQAVMGKLGEHDLYAVLLTRDLLDLMAGSDPMGMAQMMRPTLRELFGEVQGYGMGMRVNAPTAMVEQTLTAYMPNGKKGLTALADIPVQRGTLPAFVGPDTLTYTTFSFRFSGLMDVIRKVVNSNPMFAMQVGPQLDEIAPIVNQVTATLGTQVHYAMSGTQPFKGENRQTIFAIECTKPQDFENFLSPLAAQAGIEARDFLGQRIYTMPEEAAEMMMPFPGMEAGSISLGIGGGFLLIGPTSAVEQGLRASGEPGGASLASNSDFQRATGTLARDAVVAWGYSDTVDAAEMTVAVQKHTMEQHMRQMREEAEQWETEDEEEANSIKEMLEQQEKQMRDAMKIWDKINFDLLRRYIGPASWQITSGEDGFTMRSYQFGR